MDKVELKPEFSFNVKKQIHFLSEILVSSYRGSETEVEWIISGPHSVTGAYIGYQKQMAKEEKFVEFQSVRLKNR